MIFNNNDNENANDYDYDNEAYVNVKQRFLTFSR